MGILTKSYGPDFITLFQTHFLRLCVFGFLLPGECHFLIKRTYNDTYTYLPTYLPS